MRLLGFILAFSLAMGVLQAVLPVALVLLACLILWLGVTQPKATLGFLTGLTALGLIGAYPVAALTVLGVLAVSGWLLREQRNADEQ
jgi:hypothetical protein